MTTSEKTIERLSLYRRILTMGEQGERHSVYSHELAEKTGGSAAQVRRDLMTIGFGGNSNSGYDMGGLIARIGEVLDNPAGEAILLAGVGNLGRALLHFFAAYHPKLKIAAAFDNDPRKTNRVIHGCRCHPLDALETMAQSVAAHVAIVAVPAEAAQAVTDRFVQAGIGGIVNFAPVALRVPPHVVVETIDIATALEKVACLTRMKLVGAE